MVVTPEPKINPVSVHHLGLIRFETGLLRSESRLYYWYRSSPVVVSDEFLIRTASSSDRLRVGNDLITCLTSDLETPNSNPHLIRYARRVVGYGVLEDRMRLVAQRKLQRLDGGCRDETFLLGITCPLLPHSLHSISTARLGRIETRLKNERTERNTATWANLLEAL